MPVIETKDLTCIYSAGTPYEKKALDRMSMVIEPGDLVGITGANGSGKSTLIQHFNGLLVPTAGSVKVLGKDTNDSKYRRELWKQVGLVFQFPEQQFFQRTIFDEIAYGLKNLGLKNSDIENRVKDSLRKVGLNPEQVMHLSSVCLNGGGRRQVALACVLAMQPAILILDEPTAGLDSSSSERIFKTVQEMQRDYNTTVIMVSHRVDELLLFADKLAFLEQGRLVAYGPKREMVELMAGKPWGDLVLPDHLRLMHRIAARGVRVDTGIITVEEAGREIDRILKESNL